MIENSFPTAGLLIIGNEILSGQVQDINIQFLTQRLSERGIKVQEVRIVRDEEKDIIDALTFLRAVYTYVFTTGGIGPTHDDITSHAVAKAFRRQCKRHSEVQALFLKRYPDMDIATDPRLRMADLPEGCELIPCALSTAPGFKINNVFVLAGVPNIMQSMFDTLAPHLTQGPEIHQKGVFCAGGESRLALPLEEIQRLFPDLEIGSYPTWKATEETGVKIMFKGNNLDRIVQAIQAFKEHEGIRNFSLKSL